MPDFAAAYRETRDVITSLLSPLDVDRLSTIVPACPLWTIKDLVAHLVHVSETYAFGVAPYATPEMDEYVSQLIRRDGDPEATDAWTQAGVDERASLSFEQLVDLWDAGTDRLCQMMTGELALPAERSKETLSWIVVGDVAIHHQDLRGALGVEPDRVCYATKLSFASWLSVLPGRVASADVPPLRIVTERGEVTLGEGVPEQTLELDWIELLRAMTGRRSPAQIRELFGRIDAEPYLPVISHYPFTKSRLAV